MRTEQRMTERRRTRNGLPVDAQIRLIHGDLDDMEKVVERKLASLQEKMDKIYFVFIAGMLSLIVALLTIVGTVLSVA